MRLSPNRWYLTERGSMIRVVEDLRLVCPQLPDYTTLYPFLAVDSTGQILHYTEAGSYWECTDLPEGMNIVAEAAAG